MRYLCYGGIKSRLFLGLGASIPLIIVRACYREIKRLLRGDKASLGTASAAPVRPGGADPSGWAEAHPEGGNGSARCRNELPTSLEWEQSPAACSAN